MATLTQKFNPRTDDGFNFVPTSYFTTFATIAAAKAGIPNEGDGNVCYIEEKQAFYAYCTMCVRVADDDLILTTGAGGNTRWQLMQKVSRTQGDTGWIDLDSAVLSTPSSTVLRLNVTSTANIAIRSIRYGLAAGNHDITITGLSGVKFIGFNDGSGTLKSRDTLWDFASECPVAIVYWTGTAIAGAQTEFHGIRDTVWHYWAHNFFGAQYRSGLTFTGNVQSDSNTDPNLDTVQYLWSTPGVIADEDATINVGTGNWLQDLGSGLTSADAAVIPFYYWTGTAITTAAAMSDRTPFIHAGAGTTPQWENAGTLTPATDGQYIVYHYFASPLINGQSVFARPHNAVFTAPGQIANALAARPSSLIWSNYAEVKHIYTAVFRVETNWTGTPDHKCKLISLQDFRTVQGGPVAATASTAHSALSGLADAGAHPATAILTDTTDFNGVLGPADTDVLLALKTLDDMASNAAFIEGAQDAVGAMLIDTNTVDLSYIDGTPGLSAAVKYQSTPNILISDDSSGLKVDTRCCKNYIANPDTEIDTTGITAGANTTLTRITSGQLFGAGSLEITSSGAWSVTWTVNTLDAGMQNRLGEFQIIAKGAVIAGASLQVKSGTSVVGDYSAGLAQIDATNAKPFGGTFPVGALPATYTVVLSGSGAITAGNLITDLAYLGLPKSVTSGQITTPVTPYTPSVLTDSGATVTLNTGAGYEAPTGMQERKADTLLMSAAFTNGAGGVASAASGTIIEIALPSGLTVDTSKLVSTSSGFRVSGHGQINSAGSFGSVYYQASTNKLRLLRSDTNAYVSVADIVAGKVFSIEAKLPISGWQATDIVTPEASLVEYASNSSSTDADDTTSFVYGENGAQGILGTTALTATRIKKIRFQKAFLATDSFVVELFDSISSSWVPLQASRVGNLTYVVQNVTEYGVLLSGVSSTDLVVSFFRYAYPSGATYGAAGASWASLVNITKWRVKKIPAGAGSQSFYLQGPVKGGNSGNAIPAGFVGELKSVATSSATASGVNSTAVIASLTLEPGSWDLSAVCGIANGTRSSAGTSAAGVDLYNSTASASIALAQYIGSWASSATIGDSAQINGSISSHVVLTATSVIQYRVRCDDGGSATGTPTVFSRSSGVFKAVRVD